MRRRQALLAGSALPLAPLLASEALPVLRVGWDEYAPYQTAPRHAGGEPGGLDVERLRHWLKAAGLPPPRWLQMPFPRQLLALQTGELDAMLDASQVPEREPFAVWTQPYRAERVDLMALASHSLPPPTSLAALRGRRLRIALVRGSRYPGEFANLVDDPGFAALLVQVRHSRQSLQMLRLGRVDYLIDDPQAIAHLSAQQAGPAVKSVLPLVAGGARLMLAKALLQRHPELLRRLNAALPSS